MKIVLLDRDGTLIVDPPNERVMSEADIRLFPDSVSALKILADNDFSVILITNQAAIGEGTLSVEEFERINGAVLSQLSASGVKILKTYMCPHSKDDGCICRKPKPKMLQDAAMDFGFNLNDVFMIGDRPSDVLAGNNASTKTIQVMTATNPQEKADADFFAQTLTEAANIVVGSK